MVKWTYVVLSVIFGVLLTLPAVAVGTFVVTSAVGGVVTGAIISLFATAFFVLYIVQFVFLEGYGRPLINRWPFYSSGRDATLRWPVSLKLVMVLVIYAFVGWMVFQLVVSPDEFQLPSLPLSIRGS